MPKAPKQRRYGKFDWTDPKTGYLYARVVVTQADGTPKTIYKRAINVTHAKQLADGIKAEHQSRGQAYLDGRTMTFKDLAEWYKKEFVIAPVYKDDIKVEGMRTWEAERRKIDFIANHFKKTLLADLDEDALRGFRRKRLKTVSVSTINRDMETIRAMLRKAKKKKWIREVPEFEDFIQKSMERRRTVTITDDQEISILTEARKLLKDKSSPRLFALILALRDSGARPNELYPVNDYSKDKSKFEPLRWRDVMDEDGSIRDLTRLVSFKGKIKESRIAVVTERMKDAFRELWEYLKRSKNVTPDNAANLDNMIFPYTTFKKSWDIVREAAGVPDLRLRDLRRDWVTRLAKLGYSDKLAQRGAGHKTVQMSFQYTEFDIDAAMKAKAILDADNQGPQVSDAVN